LKESNPKCTIIANIFSKPIDPKVEVTFGEELNRLINIMCLLSPFTTADNNTILYDTTDMEAIQILAEINKKAKSLL